MAQACSRLPRLNRSISQEAKNSYATNTIILEDSGTVFHIHYSTPIIAKSYTTNNVITIALKIRVTTGNKSTSPRTNVTNAQVAKND